MEEIRKFWAVHRGMSPRRTFQHSEYHVGIRMQAAITMIASTKQSYRTVSALPILAAHEE